MERSDELQRILEELLGSKNVYFQPPSSIKLKYPCIIFNREPSRRRFADNKEYSNIDRYTITAIDRNPNSDIPDKITKLPMVGINRYFTKDNLYHYVFTMYY